MVLSKWNGGLASLTANKPHLTLDFATQVYISFCSRFNPMIDYELYLRMGKWGFPIIKEACRASTKPQPHWEGLGGAESFWNCFSQAPSNALRPSMHNIQHYHHIIILYFMCVHSFTVGPAFKDAGLCQEKPEQQVSIPSRPSPKLPWHS